MKKIKAYGKLFRFELPFSAGVCVILGQMFALGSFPPLFEMASGFGALFLISAAALILNDYFDVEIDKINAPERPLPSGLVTADEVLSLFITVSVLGLLVSVLIGFEALALSGVLWIVAFLYNWKFKKAGFAGNLMVSFSVGMMFIFGGVSVGVPFSELVWFFGVLSALINLGEEIATDVMDIQGDRKLRSSSLPIKFGREKALDISTSIFLTVIVLSAAPFIFDWLPRLYLIPILIMDVIILYSTLKLRRSQETDGRKLVRLIYLGVLFGMLIILFMRVLE